MAKDAIVFACANPVPEIWPWEAKEAGVRIVATGRSDFPNQVNNRGRAGNQRRQHYLLNG